MSRAPEMRGIIYWGKLASLCEMGERKRAEQIIVHNLEVEVEGDKCSLANDQSPSNVWKRRIIDSWKKWLLL